MKVAIMQPYFFPYIGYYQLIAATDVFVVYDNIKFTKKGWINRNRMLLNGNDTIFSLPLKKDSDYLDVVQREISPEFNRLKLLNQFKGAYLRAPHFQSVFPLLEKIVSFDDDNLFRYIFNSIVLVCHHLGLSTELRISSDVPIDHNLKSQDKVIQICKTLGAQTYINAIGGVDLYNKEDFRANEIDLKFIKANAFEYEQFSQAFLPWLSIIDVLMFNSLNDVRACVHSNYELI